MKKMLRLKKRLEKTHQVVWSYLMNNIDVENWATLKRLHNRLLDDLEKIKKMHDENEYALQDMRDNRKKAIKALREIKKARKSKKFRRVKIDSHTWIEIEIH